MPAAAARQLTRPGLLPMLSPWLASCRLCCQAGLPAGLPCLPAVTVTGFSGHSWPHIGHTIPTGWLPACCCHCHHCLKNDHCSLLNNKLLPLSFFLLTPACQLPAFTPASVTHQLLSRHCRLPACSLLPAVTMLLSMLHNRQAQMRLSTATASPPPLA